MHNLEERIATVAADVIAELDGLIRPAEGAGQQVVDAMRYSVLTGGKRFRPFLVMTSAQLFDVNPAHALRVAAAIEMVHCYSLIHDDLPAMDNDDLRRGRPTCHVQFDEATAILAGDGLLTLAFETLAAEDTHPVAAIRIRLVQELARAIGIGGMVGGQMADILGLGDNYEMLDAEQICKMKTGRLISFSCESGAILGAVQDSLCSALRRFGNNVGVAFQITDDIMDVEGTVEQVGKATQKDAGQQKSTIVSLLGLDLAKRHAKMVADRAIADLHPFGPRAGLLREAAEYALSRRF